MPQNTSKVSLSRKKFFVIASVLLLLLLLFLKPLATYFLQSYLGFVLQTPVNIRTLSLSQGKVQASITNENNLADITVNTYFPFEAEVQFSGNIDAFKHYHPLKAEAMLKGTVQYEDALVVKAVLSSMGAEAKVEVREEGDEWSVDANISHLDLRRLQAENSLPLEISGLVDAEMDLHTKNDSYLKITSEKVKIEQQVLKEATIEATKAKGHIGAYALFEADEIDYKGIWFNYDEQNASFNGKVDLRYKKEETPILLELEGTHNSTALSAQAGLTIWKSHMAMRGLEYDLISHDATAEVELDLREIEQHLYLLNLIGVELQGDLKAKANLAYKEKKLSLEAKTQSLGGELFLSYADETVKWKAEKLALSKIAHLFKSDEKLSAELYSQGSFAGGQLDAAIESALVLIGTTKLEGVKFKVFGPLKELQVQTQLSSEYATVEKASAQITDMKDIGFKANVTTPYTSAPIAFEGKGSYTKEASVLSLKSFSDEFNVTIPEAVYKDGRVDGNYSAVIEPTLSTLTQSLNLKGDFSYEKAFHLLARTRDFGGLLKIGLHGDKVKLDASQIRLKKVLQSLDQSVYARGRLDAKASGTFEKIDFTLSSKNLHLDKERTGLDENLSAQIKGRYGSSGLYLWPAVTNRYIETDKGEIHFAPADKKIDMRLPLEFKKENESLPVVLHSHIELKEAITADIRVQHVDDTLHLKGLSYKEKALQTAIVLDIKELQDYAKFLKIDLYGPLAVSGDFDYKEDKPNLVLMTQSLGGRADLSLQDKELLINLEDLLALHIGRLFKDKAGAKQGDLNGRLRYDLESKNGGLELSARNIFIRGIDIDNSLQELNDVLGLNIFAMGKSLFKKGVRQADLNLTTEISHAELDVTITPELIISKDIAISTKNNRFAVNTKLRHDGEIKEFEVAILDLQGCAILTQKLKGNIASPKLVGTEGTAVVILAQTPEQILKTGGKIIDAGAGIIDSAASFLWTKGLRQDSKVTLIENTLGKGKNIFSSGKELLVSGKCKIYYKGKVKHPE